MMVEMNSPAVECAHCGYEIASFTEALEALEGGGRCLLCGGDIAKEALERAVDNWSDEKLIQEGKSRADQESEVMEEEELLEGGPDFGDDGEDEEDPLL